ncbi:MAG: polysaccharide biosynthesis protein [Haemophilus parainfluenzae]
MVTGAGIGSIGSELCRQIILNEPNILILFELSEFSLYAIHQELLEIVKKNNITNTKIYPVLGNVQDNESSRSCFISFSKCRYYLLMRQHISTFLWLSIIYD